LVGRIECFWQFPLRVNSPERLFLRIPLKNFLPIEAMATKPNEWAFYGLGVQAGRDGKLEPYHCCCNFGELDMMVSPSYTPPKEAIERLRNIHAAINGRGDGRVGSLAFAHLLMAGRNANYDWDMFKELYSSGASIGRDNWTFGAKGGGYRSVEVIEYAPPEDMIVAQGWDREALLADLMPFGLSDAIGFPVGDHLRVFGVFDRGTQSFCD